MMAKLTFYLKDSKILRRKKRKRKKEKRLYNKQ